jgi:chloride channel protein, CIC family
MKSFARSPKNDHVPSLPEQVGMILIGVFAGGLAVAFHAVINLAEKTREQLAVLADSHSLAAEIGIMLACGLLAATAVGMVRLIAPEAEGSGIAAVLVAHRTVSPRRAMRILWVKFAAGFCGLASGMPLGREGPSVQIGAMASVILRRYGPRLIYSKTRAVHLGAAAGLAAAFNAPLSGAVFSFEMLRQPFNTRNGFETIMVCAVADWICRLAHGPILQLPIELNGFREVQELPMFLLVGLWAGLVAIIFQLMVVGAARWFHARARTHAAAILVAAAWGALLGFVLLEWPQLLGIGEDLFHRSIDRTLPIGIAFLALAARLPLTSISYASGAPGGLIVPALLFGVLSGRIFAGGYEALVGPQEVDFHAVCLVAGMAASIGALFRTPLTATIMAVEITGSYACLLEISIAYVAAHSMLGLAGLPDLYTALGRVHAATESTARPFARPRRDG